MSDDEAEVRTANCAKIFVALDYLTDGLNSFVQQQLQRNFGDAWQENVSRVNGHAADLTDPYVLLATIDDKWHIFSICFKSVPYSVVKELRNVRNSTSHSGSFSDKEVDNSISSLLRFLNSISPSAKIVKAEVVTHLLIKTS